MTPPLVTIGRFSQLTGLTMRALRLYDEAIIEGAAALRRPGPNQVEAAIAACHAEGPSFESTDWMQVVALYDLLLEMEPSPVIRLNRALAVWRVSGAQTALRELDGLAEELDGYHIYHAARGELLSEMGSLEQARAARLQAHDLNHNQAERALLRQRLLLCRRRAAQPSYSPTT